MREATRKKTVEIAWDNVLPRLQLYALRQIRSLRLEGGIAPEDVVYSAILKVLERDISQIEDVTHYLMVVIKHDILDIARRQLRQLPLEEAETKEGDTDEALNKRVEDTEFLEHLRNSVKDDLALSRLVESMIEDSSLKSAEVAEKLGISVHELYKLKKRLQKRVIKLKSEPMRS